MIEEPGDLYTWSPVPPVNQLFCDAGRDLLQSCRTYFEERERLVVSCERELGTTETRSVSE